MTKRHKRNYGTHEAGVDSDFDHSATFDPQAIFRRSSKILSPSEYRALRARQNERALRFQEFRQAQNESLRNEPNSK